jgi:hypothetical protein
MLQIFSSFQSDKAVNKVSIMEKPVCKLLKLNNARGRSSVDLVRDPTQRNQVSSPTPAIDLVNQFTSSAEKMVHSTNLMRHYAGEKMGCWERLQWARFSSWQDKVYPRHPG